MKTILDKIIDYKFQEVAETKKYYSIERLKDDEHFHRKCYDFAGLIREKSGVIAEFKRKSPSKGLINKDVWLTDVVKGYEAAGASAISVLTDTIFFGGTSNDLKLAREIVDIPILRKDFMVDEFQLVEAKAMGADVILLIAAAIEKSRCQDLAAFAKSIGLNVFLELHEPSELEHIDDNVDVVGINNRNLKTFKVDVEQSKRLSQLLPTEMVKVAESGISNPSVVKDFKSVGFEGFLIGEYFMRHKDPKEACAKFIQEINA
jgi:indole-3-glycerol phosphate synthase